VTRSGISGFRGSHDRREPDPGPREHFGDHHGERRIAGAARSAGGTWKSMREPAPFSMWWT
jgi:hypothetical protein